MTTSAQKHAWCLACLRRRTTTVLTFCPALLFLRRRSCHRFFAVTRAKPKSERERERVCFRMCVRMSVMHLLGPFLSHAVLLVLLDWSSTATGARLQYSFGKKSNRSRQFHTSFHRPSVNADRIRAGVHRAFVVMQSVGLHRGALHAVRGACKLCNTRGKDQS